MGTRRFVIPDIHGCARTFSALLKDVLNVDDGDRLYLLGDYTDRGPRSKEVVDLIMGMKARGRKVHSLRGNHDDMLVRACGSLDHLRLWLLNGGRTTLESFGIDDPCDFPTPYRRFFSGLPHFLELEDFILVHAGLNFAIENPFADTEAMLWTRSQAVDTARTGGRRIISGHTPVTRAAIRDSLNTDHILLDNGCVYAGAPDMGALAALELNSLSLYFMKNID